MRARYTCFQVRSLAALALLLCTSGLAQAQAQAAPSPVRVQVYGTHEGGNIVYHYKVINNSAFALHSIVIGSKYYSEENAEDAQLEREPLGWNYGPEGESGTLVLLAPNSTTQPPFWAPRMYGPGPGALFLEWSIVTDGGQPYMIPPGQSLAGFSVTVPLFDDRQAPPDYYNAGQIVDPTVPDVDQHDDKYLRSSFKAQYVDDKYSVQPLRGQLEVADTTPPTLSVTLTPSVLKPNEKMMTINATITAKDDVDPNPEIKLVSITANEAIDHDDIKVKGVEGHDLDTLWADIRQFQLKAERDGNNKAGRIYTVTYLALDASGNEVTTTATVTVPHDMDEHEGRERKDKQSKKDK